MSKVFNMVGGGGGKNISSIIITGPESTDTITCTKDEKTYPAIWDSTAQHWTIIGLPLGTFTVTATNGTNTKSATVLIDIAGVYEIEIYYKLWLYRDGDECEDVTGGWVFCPWHNSYYSNGTLTKNDTSILLSSSAMHFAGVRPSNMIDLTNYSKIVIIVESRTGSGTYSWSGVSVYPSLSDLGGSGNEVEGGDISIGTTGEKVIDISSISGEKYIVCFASADGGSSATLRFSGMYLI